MDYSDSTKDKKQERHQQLASPHTLSTWGGDILWDRVCSLIHS